MKDYTDFSDRINIVISELNKIRRFSDFSSRISYALKMLDNIHVAADNVYDYLISLNLKQLQKTNKRDKSEDSREFYERLQEQSKQGPIFSNATLDIIKNYRVKIDKNTAKWLATQIEDDSINPPTEDELSNLFDWIQDQEPKLEDFGFEEAIEASDEWHEGFKSADQTGKYKTKNVDHDFGDGFTMVSVPVEDLDVEGSLMQHCVGSYKNKVEKGTKIYSLRDSQNKPHVTIKVIDDRIKQVRGKQNAEPISKYRPYVWEWATSKNMHKGVIAYAPLEYLEELSRDADPEIRSYVARSSNTSPETLTQLSGDANKHVREGVAKNPKTSPETLAKLSGDTDLKIRHHVALNPNTPLEILTKLSGSRNKHVREGVADNPNISPEILIKLADDTDPEVRQSVAMNRNTPPETLTKLSGDTDVWVRCYVASNSNTPSETLTRLSGDTDSNVRRNVALNPDTSPEILIKLSGDTYPIVRRNVALNPDTPLEILTQLSDDTDPEVRCYVASNSNTPSETLTRLSGDTDSNVRRNVARNSNTPLEILTRLSDDTDPSVSDKARKRLESNTIASSDRRVIMKSELNKIRRVSDSSLPVSTLPGPRVEHIGPGQSGTESGGYGDSFGSDDPAGEDLSSGTNMSNPIYEDWVMDGVTGDDDPTNGDQTVFKTGSYAGKSLSILRVSARVASIPVKDNYSWLPGSLNERNLNYYELGLSDSEVDWMRQNAAP